jgi:hypothetical protein
MIYFLKKFSKIKKYFEKNQVIKFYGVDDWFDSLAR